MNHPEDNEQKAVFEWAAYYPVLDWMFAVPNGVFLSGGKIQRAKQMNRLKKQGLKPGVYDICVPIVTDDYPGMFIEMKRPDGKGRLSDKQRSFDTAMADQGYRCVVCNTAADAISEIKKYAGI